VEAAAEEVDDETDSHGGEDPHAVRLRTDLGSKLSPVDRWRYGWQCKRLLDAGRMLYLREHLYDGWMEEYCELKVSPENVLLIASRGKVGQRGDRQVTSVTEAVVR
jgi:tRNA:m4X modification enzyme